MDLTRLTDDQRVVAGDLAAEGAVDGAISATLEGDLELSTTIGLGCALDELPNVGLALEDATNKLQGSISAVASVSGTVGG